MGWYTMDIKKILILLLFTTSLFAQISHSWTTEQKQFARKGDVPNQLNSVNLSYYASLSIAITDISTTSKNLIIDKNISVSSDLTIPSNIDLIFTNGKKITLTDTLIINGSINTPLSQIFTLSGNGYVNLANAKLDKVYPQWFGAYNDSSNTAITTRAFQNAINSIGTSKKTFFIPTGKYSIGTATDAGNSYWSLEINGNACWEGEGSGSVLYFSEAHNIGCDETYYLWNQPKTVEMKNFKIVGNGSSDYGIYLNAGGATQNLYDKIYINNIQAEDFNQIAICANGGWKVTVKDCNVKGSGIGEGAVTASGRNVLVKDNIVENASYAFEIATTANSDYPDTTYSIEFAGNTVEGFNYGLRISRGDYVNVHNNKISWNNLDATTYNDTTKKGDGVQLDIVNIRSLRFDNNQVEGFIYGINFSSSSARTYYTTDEELLNLDITNNYFGENGSQAIYIRRTLANYWDMSAVNISNNTFYHWWENQGTGANKQAINLDSLDNVTISGNIFTTVSGNSTTPMWLTDINGLSIKDNYFQGTFYLTGTNTEVEIVDNYYPPTVTNKYAFYDGDYTYYTTQHSFLSYDTTFTYDPGIVYAGETLLDTIAYTEARLGDYVVVNAPYTLNDELIVTGHVIADSQVVVKIYNTYEPWIEYSWDSDISGTLTWNNGVTNPYETFTTGDDSIASAINTTGTARCWTSTGINATAGDIFKVTFNLTLNSGQLPSSLQLKDNEFGTTVSGYYTIVEGANTHYIQATVSDATTGLFMLNSSAANWSLTDLTVQKLVRTADVDLNAIDLASGSWRIKIIK